METHDNLACDSLKFLDGVSMLSIFSQESIWPKQASESIPIHQISVLQAVTNVWGFFHISLQC